MKKRFKPWLTLGIAAFTAMHTVFLSGCKDDIPADSYYTFTGEMMSDFLTSREDFSLFAQVVERGNKMSFLGSRGARTLFPPTNAAMERFMQEKGYASVEDMSVGYCDTLVKACMLNTALYTYDLAETRQEQNGLDLPLVIQTTGDTVDAAGMVLTMVNRTAAIINELKNDSVDNGVVHPVDRVIEPTSVAGKDFLESSCADFTIFYEALVRTGLIDSLEKYRDEEYEEWKNNYPEFRTGVRPGNYEYMPKRPDHRYYGFTLFAVPDAVLYEKYSDRFNEGMTMDEKIDALCTLAMEKYNNDEDAEKIFGLNEIDPKSGRTNKEEFWNLDSLTSRFNPLNILMSYHIVDRMFASTDVFVNRYGWKETLNNPTEWVTTLLDFTMMKIEFVYPTVDPAVEAEYPRSFYLNHTEANEYNNGRVRGAHVTVPDITNFSLNVAFYYVDDFLLYDVTTRKQVFNTRIRIDCVTLWPELTNNNMRLQGDITGQPGHDATADNSETGSAGDYNYYLPPGYLKNVEYSDNVVFMVQRPHLRWWSWGGDEIDITGDGYDVTFRLPPVPPGTYEVRFAYPGGVGNRGIAQVYFNGEAQGLPVDMTYGGTDSRVSGLYDGAAGIRQNRFTEEELEENARVMRNNGYYSCGRGQISYVSGDIPTGSGSWWNSSNTVLYDIAAMLRRRINDEYWIVNNPREDYIDVRFRSVTTGNANAAFVLDFIELVPTSICGPGGIGEDLN